jgi:4'-phosphopantetheinyl transferase
VWLVATDLADPDVVALSAVLDESERRRAAALSFPDDRRRYTVAHAATRIIVARALGVPPTGVRWRAGRHGKPHLVDAQLQVNLSHSGDLAMLALSAVRPVGVDVQRLIPDRDATELAARYFPAEEARFVAVGRRPADRFARLWVRKEACVKAAGGRLVEGLALPVRGTGPVGPNLVRDIPVPDGFRAAVALDGHHPFRVASRWWRQPATSTAARLRYRSAGS